MRISMFVVSMFVGAALAACGGSGKDGDPDAAGGDDVDAKVFLDAPTGGQLAGLGQKCGTGLPACPATAPDCIGIQGGPATQYCTPKCVTDGTAKGAAGTGGGPNQLSMIMPAPSNSTCAAQFTGTVGMPVCALISAYTPMDMNIVVNKNYTGVAMECAILCGTGNTCPSGMAPDTSLGACVCFPM